MVKLEQPFIFNDFSSGMIDDGAVSDSLLPRNAVRKAINCVFDNPRGSVAGRLGSTRIGQNLSNRIRGVYNFRDAGTGTNHQLLATNNLGTTYYYDGANLVATLAGDTAALKTRFVTFLDLVARLNGTDAARSWNGDTAVSWAAAGGALDVGNWPTLSRFAVVFNSRVYTAGSTANQDTLSYSSIPSSGAISWTSGNGSLQVNPNDGDSGITGLGTNGTVLLVFKRNSLYRWDGQATFANKVISIGTPSNESIAAHDSGWVYFFGIGKNSVGVYRTSGGYPQKISLNISKWMEAISVSNYDDVAGFADDDHYYLSVGSVTVDGQTYTNAWFVYTISLQCWHIENHAQSFKVFAGYIDSNNNLTTVGGDTAGNVQTINSGTTDNTTAISAECEFAPILFTTRSHTKTVSRLTTYANFFQGLKFFLKIDQSDFKELGEIKKTEQNFTGFYNYSGLFRGKRFFPKISVANSNVAWQFDGFEFQEIIDEGYFQ